MIFEEQEIAYHIPNYTETHFEFGDEIHAYPIVFHLGKAEKLPENHWHELTTQSFQAALQAKADVILLGTGKQQHFIATELMAHAAQKGVMIECMNTAAACRTLLLLQAEGRNVWAYLFL